MLAYTRIYFSSIKVNLSQILVKVMSVKFLIRHKNTWVKNPVSQVKKEAKYAVFQVSSNQVL